jgi:hypothetical protein
VQSTSGLFHFRRAAFSSQLKAKVGSTLAKAAALRVNLDLDGAPITSRTHTHPSHSQKISCINLVIIFRCSSSPNNQVHVRRVDFSGLVFSLSSHRHSGVLLPTEIKSKCGNILPRTTELRIILNITCVVKITHSPFALGNFLFINLVSIFMCSSPSCNPVYVRHVDPSTLAFSHSSLSESHLQRHQLHHQICNKTMVSTSESFIQPSLSRFITKKSKLFVSRVTTCRSLNFSFYSFIRRCMSRSTSLL